MNPLAEFAARISDAPLAPDRGGYTLTMRECAGAEEAIAVDRLLVRFRDPALA